MRYFPITRKPVWGRTESWEDVSEWYTRMAFTRDSDTEQEVVPAYYEAEAVLKIKGDIGNYIIDFPGGRTELDLRTGTADVDVSSLIRTGKHIYKISGSDGQLFDAVVDIKLKCPLVNAEDEGFMVDWNTMKEGRRQIIGWDQGAQRVGRWSCWVKASPTEYNLTRLKEKVDIEGLWKFHPPLQKYAADLSGLNINDDSWKEVEVPHQWDDSLRETKGYAWYRRWVSIPDSWKAEQIVLRFEGVDYDALVYVNGHEVGFHMGWDRSFQFEIKDYVEFGKPNLVTVRVRSRYTKGGMYAGVSMGTVESYGVAFEGRVYPAKEGCCRVSAYEAVHGAAVPVGFGKSSSFHYCPPVLGMRSLEGKEDKGISLKASTDIRSYNNIFELTGKEGAEYLLHVRVNAESLGVSDISAKAFGNGLVISGEGEGLKNLYINLPGCTGWTVLENWAGCDEPVLDNRGHAGPSASLDVILSYKVCGQSKALLTVGAEPCEYASMDDAVKLWDEAVFNVARPVKMSDLQAAAFRTYKQTVALDSRYVKDDVCHGLLADFDKPIFVVYWMRDCCISVPGAIYTGGESYKTAIANAGPTLDRYTDVMECEGVFPDGRVQKGSYSDGPALGLYAQSYAHALEGKEWIEKQFPSTVKMIEYLINIDCEDEDELDGIIRSSRGDWKDYSSMGKYKCMGASFFVNVCYLRALRVAADMAEAVGELDKAAEWREIRKKGMERINKPVRDGGLWLEDEGHFADTIMVPGKTSWAYPRDMEDIVIFSSFETFAHGMALAEGIVTYDNMKAILSFVEREGLIGPVPAPARFPFYDVFAELGIKGLPETHEFSDPWLKKGVNNLPKPGTLIPDMTMPWKGWPGNHIFGGRWPLCGAWLELGLWKAGQVEWAQKARYNLERSLLRARYPARCLELESYSAVSREETGAHPDPAGYYQLWSGAVPLQAIVEGVYGASAAAYGARIDMSNCAAGDGLSRFPIRGGELSYMRLDESSYEIRLNTTVQGTLEVYLPGQKVEVNGICSCSVSEDGSCLRIKYNGSECIRLKLAGNMAGCN